MSWIVAALCALQAPADAVEPQDPDRPTYSAADLKALREANLFSPHRKPGSAASGRREDRRAEPRAEAAPARLRPLQVTGFVLDPATKTPRAILEDRNEERLRTLKEPLFAKPGDTAAGWTVEEVTPEGVTIAQGESKKTLKVGESFPEPAGAAPAASGETPAAAPEEVKPPPLDDGAKNDILERLRQKNKKKRTDEP